MKIIERSGFLRDGDYIKVCPEGEIYIDDGDLPASEYLPVSKSEAQIIFSDFLATIGCATGG